jgi:putative ABC transport system permease protein
MLVKNPGFALPAILCLGLGIGACAAIFSVVDPALLRPLPFPDADRLVWIREEKLDSGRGNMVSQELVLDLREQIQSLEAVATLQWASYVLAGGEFPQRLTGVQVSTNFFQTVGVGPALGRAFLPGEDTAGRDNVIVISHGLWQRQFGGDPNLIGRSVTVNGRPHTIVGVTPPRFQFWLSARCHIWQPCVMGPSPTSGPRGSGNEYFDRRIAAFGRLKADAHMEQAQNEAALLAELLAKEHPTTNAGWTIRIDPAREMMVFKESQQSLLLLLGAVGFVLLIACANVANLLLGRAASREKEMAIRATLGAGRWRVARLVLTESLLLALLGAGLGLLLTHWGTGLLTPLIPPGLPLGKEIGVDGRMFACALIVVMITAAATGLAPAWQSCRANLTVALKEGGTRSVTGPGRKPARKILVVCEVALALILFTGAGLMIQTVVRLLRVDTGFDPENLLAFKVNTAADYQRGGINRLPEYKEPNQLRTLWEQLLERVASLPGVVAVGSAARGGGFGYPYKAEGQTTSVNVKRCACTVGVHDSLRAMGIPLLQGRRFTENDAMASEHFSAERHNIIISKAAARQLWPGASPIGKRIRRDWGEGWPWLTVIGVAGDVRLSSYADEAGPAFYIPYQRLGDETPMMLEFVVRTSADPLGLIEAIRREIRALDSRLPVSDFITLEDRLMQSTARQRLYMQLLTVFAAIGLVIAAVGIYGVISYSVVQRTHEMGLRMALGAQRMDVFRLVIKKGLTLIAIGLAIGVAGALALTRVLGSLLYGVTPTDPATFVLVSLLLAAVGLLACYIPARRATKIDPMAALRYE